MLTHKSHKCKHVLTDECVLVSMNAMNDTDNNWASSITRTYTGLDSMFTWIIHCLL